MPQLDGYSSGAAVEQAIKSAAKEAKAAGLPHDVGQLIELEYLHRFLSRVFTDRNAEGWVLKGGTGMLARIPTTRYTTDIDLYRCDSSIDDALSDLRRVAAIDLRDHFRFEYAAHTPIVAGEGQPYALGYDVKFDTYIGTKNAGPVHVDLVVGIVITDHIEIAEPENALQLPRLASSPYRLYPLVDQIADKVCATATIHNGRESSRIKDVIDLLVIATNSPVSGSALTTAITAEAARRELTLDRHLSVPSSWKERWAREARKVPLIADFPTVEAAQELITRFVDPALSAAAESLTWDPTALTWV